MKFIRIAISLLIATLLVASIGCVPEAGANKPVAGPVDYSPLPVYDPPDIDPPVQVEVPPDITMPIFDPPDINPPMFIDIPPDISIPLFPADPHAPVDSPVIIFQLTSRHTQSTSIAIGWRTDSPATSQVEYGTTTDYGLISMHDTMRTSHEVILNGLSDGTTYHFRVKSENEAGTATVSDDYGFTTNQIIEISDVRVLVTGQTATFTWATDVPSTGVVYYGVINIASRTPYDRELVTSHSITIEDLLPYSDFLFIIVSASGYSRATSEGWFSTAASDWISGVTASDIGNTSAAINWLTDSPATSMVEYGTTTAYGSTTTLDATTLTGHDVALTGLVPGTPYHFRVISIDDLENEVASDDYTFDTLAAVQ